MTPDRFQAAVIEHVAHGQGHLVVDAKAGSGKTSTLMEAVRQLGKTRGVLICAFGREDREELQRRAPPGVKVATHHQIGMSTLSRNFGGQVKIDDRKGRGIAFRVLNAHATHLERTKGYRIDVASYVGDLLRLVKLAKSALPGELEEVADLARNHGLESKELKAPTLATLTAQCLRMATEDTERVDFDDMLYLPQKLALEPDKFQYVFVDEAQDMGPAQHLLVHQLCRPGGRIIAIGDARQAIYQWRGADRRSMSRLVEELGAATLPLSVTYRCPKAVVEHVRHIVPDLEARPGAPEGKVEEVPWDRLESAFGPHRGDFILSRTNAPLMALCTYYLRHRIPCVIPGKDIGRSLINLIRESGASTVIDLEGWLSEYLDATKARLSAEDDLDSFENFEDRAEAILAVADGERHVADVIKNIENMFGDDSSVNAEDALVCSTVHKCKGKERDRVWILKNSWRLKEDEWGEEETNIYYVACTRSRRDLMLVNGGPKEPRRRRG